MQKTGIRIKSIWLDAISAIIKFKTTSNMGLTEGSQINEKSTVS